MSNLICDRIAEMEKGISKTRVDRLGDRLRKGEITDSDLRLLDEYRRSFTEVYGEVAGAIRLNYFNH
jgi:hypothetical protein